MGSDASDMRIVCAASGGPEVLVPRELELASPAAGEVRVRHDAIGVNYIDVYLRSGLYPAQAPFTPGFEAAGVVEELGAGVAGLVVGDRVAYAATPAGAYATRRNLAAARLVRLPASVSCAQAACSMLKGLSAHYLLHDSFKAKPGDHLLVHAASGGVGSLLVPWAKRLGARVLAVVGSSAKVERARRLGADEVVDASSADFVAHAKAFTDGRGVDCVYDSVGGATFARSLACLRTRGTLVSFGQSSGAVPPFDVLELAKRSLFLTRPSLWDHVDARDELEARAEDLFRLLADGTLSAEATASWPLVEARAAHEALQSRATTGSILLLPS